MLVFLQVSTRFISSELGSGASLNAVISFNLYLLPVCQLHLRACGRRLRRSAPADIYTILNLLLYGRLSAFLQAFLKVAEAPKLLETFQRFLV